MGMESPDNRSQAHRLGRWMIRQAAWRRLSTLLIGLFLTAQVCGVVQLLGEHTTHITESQLALSQTTFAGSAPRGHHHEGDADGTIQHHELQDLNGAPLRLTTSREPRLRPAALQAYVPHALAGSYPALPERPPMSFPSV